MSEAPRPTLAPLASRRDARAPMRLAPGVTLDRYTLMRELAEGGMGSVWLARIEGKHGFERQVAIKTILTRFAGDRSVRDMFLNEAKIASRIDHPNVARIFDLGEAHGVVYLVMEWVDGAGLDVLRRHVRKEGRAFPLPYALRILADAAAGLHAAHDLRGEGGRPLHVVHRDVSPHNVLVSTAGVAKVIDFGVAKARDQATKSTTFGTIKGKLRYMAPEQARGLEVDRRADVWALGAVLYELVVGQLLHEGLSDMAILTRLTTGYALPPLPATVPAPVARILERCLAERPEARYATALELRDALDDAAAALDARARPEAIAAFLATELGDEGAERRAAADVPAPAESVISAIQTRAAAPRALRPEEPPPAIVETPAAPALVVTYAPERSPRTMRRAAVVAGFALVVLLATAIVTARPPAATSTSAATPSMPAPVPTLTMAAPPAPPSTGTAEIEPFASARGAAPAAPPITLKKGAPKRAGAPKRPAAAVEQEARSSWQNSEEL